MMFKSVNNKCLRFAEGDRKTNHVKYGRWKRQLPKIQCYSWPSPVLIFHFLHTTSTPASAPHTVPVSTPIRQAFQQAPSVSCQPLRTEWVPCKNPQGQWLHSPALCPPPKQSMLPHLGRVRRWLRSQRAKVAARTPAELCCHPLGLPNQLHIHQHLLSVPIPYICVVQQTAQAVCVPALGTCPSRMLPFALTGQFHIYTPL